MNGNRPRYLALIAVVALLGGCGGSSRSSSGSGASTAAKLDAPAELQPPAPSPDFALRDSTGKLVRLSQFKGKAVLLTFIYTHCPDVCPLIVANLHNALVRLGADANKVQIVAVSVDPKGDTPKTVKAFLAAREMTGRVEYLIGSRKQLTPVWGSYGIEAQGTPDSREGSHTALVYGITASGKRRALYPSNFQPDWIVHDVPVLASDPSGPSGATDSASRLDSGLHARVLFGPTCPVQRAGQSCIRPYQATIRILREPTNKAVASARSGADGRFSVRLPPGRYLLEPQAGRPFPRSRPQTVTVYAHRFTSGTINYDSGIR
jgi:protein SCO1